MSDAGTKRLIGKYEENATTPGYLASQFPTTERSFHNSESVEIDVRRGGRKIAIALTTITSDGRRNEVSQFTNKEWKPPIFKEKVTVDSFQGLKRIAGVAPHEDAQFNAAILEVVSASSHEMEGKIRRSNELMAAQVLQTAKLSLKDEDAAVKYELDYKPKSTHFPTVGVNWSAGGTKLLDIENLAEVIRVDGKENTEELVFGRTAFRHFLADVTVQSRFDIRNIDLGKIATTKQANGSTSHGVITIGDYSFQVVTYNDSYEDPQTGADTPYIHPDSVILKPAKPRFVMSWGAIPQFPGAPVDALQFVPSRISGVGMQLDLNWRAWFDPSRDFLTVQVGCRPLTIPVMIDTFGCLKTSGA